MNQSNVAVSPSSGVSSADAAYESVLEELAGVQEADLVHINVDVTMAVTTALHALGAIRGLRSELKAALKNFDAERFDKLETYAWALFHAHAKYVGATLPVEAMPELVAEATRMRDLLLSDAQALARRGILDGTLLRGVKVATGYRPLALDLEVLASMLEANWGKLKGKTAISQEELVAAHGLASRLLSAIGQVDRSPAAQVEAGQARQRAYSLFFRAYDEVRRAVTYLRWHEDDVEQIIPSLFAGRGAGRRTDGQTPTVPSDTTPPVVSAPATPAAPSTGPQAAPSAPPTGVPIVPVPVGLPGSAAFVRA
ncbi:MAG: hypothetical protein JWN04_93 [Myxococcaceae bacterium]|nr:hypothetical protein [Myxococcaceae bacterium]